MSSHDGRRLPCLKVEVEPQPDEKYNEEIKRGKIICGRPSYGDEPCPDATKRACKKADPAPEDHPELRIYVKYTPKEEDALVVPEDDEPAPADQESGMGNVDTDNAAADMPLDEINYKPMGVWNGPSGDISASPEPRPSEQALAERGETSDGIAKGDVSGLVPKLCHCDKWLAGGSNELKYRCVKVEGTVKNPVNVCTENYGGKVNGVERLAGAGLHGGASAAPPSPPPAPPSLPSPPPRRRRRRRACRRRRRRARWLRRSAMGKIGTLADALISRGAEDPPHDAAPRRPPVRRDARARRPRCRRAAREIRHEHARGAEQPAPSADACADEPRNRRAGGGRTERRVEGGRGGAGSGWGSVCAVRK